MRLGQKTSEMAEGDEEKKHISVLGAKKKQ